MGANSGGGGGGGVDEAPSKELCAAARVDFRLASIHCDCDDDGSSGGDAMMTRAKLDVVRLVLS